MQRTDFRYFERLRVRWAEIDAQQIVFNGHYLMYFDTAIAGYWRALAMPYHETMTALGGDMFVRKATLEYLGSAVYDDVLDVGMRCARVGNSSILFQAGRVPAGAAARERRARLRVRRPQGEAGAPGAAAAARAVRELRGRRADGRGARRQLARARSGGAPDPQRGVHRRAEDSGRDGMGRRRPRRGPRGRVQPHGPALATGRMLEHVPGTAKIGRMAVAATARHCGVGRAVLDALLDAARARGDRQAMLHAQLGAARFYERAGFVRRGPAFDEAGIAHVEMLRAL
jgi:YbgC/YbaW family acyl-CoA thioester hydrolase